MSYIISSGITSDGIILENDTMTVLDGGIATQTTINSRGSMYISSGGIADSTTLNSVSPYYYGGGFFVYSGGTANNTTVNSGGSMHVSSGGTATGIVAASGAFLGLTVAPDTYIQGTYDGSAFEMKNAYISKYTVSAGSFYVLSGGTANDTTVSAGGSMYISSGGTATNIIAASGAFLGLTVAPDTYIQGTMDGSSFETKEGILSGYSMSRNMCLDVLSGGTVFRTTNDYGLMTIYSGGIANSIAILGYTGDSGGRLSVTSGGSAQHVVINGGNMNVGGTADFVTIYMGYANVGGSGGCMNNAIVYSGCNLRVNNGGVLSNTTIYTGGILNAGGGKITGLLNISNGAKVTVFSSTILDFDISNRTPGTQVLVNNFFTNLTKGKESYPSFTLTVSESQITGLYALANDVFFYGYTITVQNTQGEGLGELSLDKSLTIGETTYTLYLDDSLTLTLSVKAPDTSAPTVSNIQASTTELTNQNVVVTAEFADDEGVASVFYKLGDNGLWLDYPEGGVTIYENGTVYFKAVDAAGNESEVAKYEVTNIDKVAPEKPVATADVTTPTNMDVLVTAVFSEDSVVKQYSFDGENWGTYPGGVLVGTNLTVYFRGIDAAGNVSEAASYEVTNVDRSAPVITLTGDNQTPAAEALLTAETDDGSVLYYCVDDSGWKPYTEAITVTANGSYSFRATDAAGNTAVSEILFANIKPTAPVNLVGTADGVSWDSIGANYYLLEYSQDDFAHVLVFATPGTAVDTLNLPGGTYQWRVKDADDDSGDWAVGEPITSENDPGTAKVLQADGDGNYDLFFANPCGTWETGYFAQHVGSIEESNWGGTQEYAAIAGKNKLADFFVGSDDLSILQLTDDANGDALFVDDIYTELPGTLEEQQARIAQISEIRGGGGDDIIDMTSQRFEYIGDGTSLRGGDGNDVLWANKGDNWLFGDLGNDRLVGASGDDLIVGGAGDDRMHGGGGDDFFTFCENWGKDTVEQLAGGKVTLWFASGDKSKWNEAKLTYTDGENSVTVKGVTAEQIELKFGDDGTEMFAWLAGLDAFEAYSSRKIFEEPATGILAGPQ